jgi:hypothetical protein
MANTGTALAKKEEKEDWFSKAWRYWKMGWAALRNTFYCALVYFAFEKMSTAFETIVLALLIMIFLNVSGSLTTIVRLNIEEALVVRKLLVGLFKKLPNDEWEIEQTEERLAEIKKDYDKNNGVYYVNIGFNSLIYSYTGWKLIQLLVLS